jgi:hypothetical protein
MPKKKEHSRAAGRRAYLYIFVAIYNYMAHRIVFSLILAVLIWASLQSNGAYSQTVNDTVTLDVNISTVATISVLPTALNWTGLGPGSDGQVKNLTLRNVGSQNVTSIHVTVNTTEVEASNPLPTGNSSFYAAGGLIFIQNETGTSRYYHLGRLEWNISKILLSEVLNISQNTTKFAHGWYRNSTGDEFLWKVENGSLNLCNNSGTTLRVSLYAENESYIARDLSDAVSVAGTPNENGAVWTLFSFTSGPLEDYCVATRSSCDRIYLYKFDKTSLFDGCTNSNYLTQEVLVPGNLDRFKVYASIPLGFPGGDTSQSVMTFFATGV